MLALGAFTVSIPLRMTGLVTVTVKPRSVMSRALTGGIAAAAVARDDEDAALSAAHAAA